MARLEAATEALNKALQALEKQTARLIEARAQAARDAGDLARITGERDRLLARITELEDENRSLAGVTEEVEGKLDGAIAEIRAALAR